MKIRTGFVSNSSSSSFLVIGASGNYDHEFYKSRIGKGIEFNGESSTVEFGWGPETIYDVESRINFAYLQTLANTDPTSVIFINSLDGEKTWLDLLEKVIKNYTGATDIIWGITDNSDVKDKTFGQIDHQSSAYEGENTQIFESEEVLKRFLFDVESKIELDNDNH